MTRLADHAARLQALTELDSTLLVEAAAGTGKTALMAGRLTMLLAHGVEPGSIAAITFTELAASALGARVHRYVGELLAGQVPEPLQPALPLVRLGDRFQIAVRRGCHGNAQAALC
jgi:ATP-dependent exoDNAse (exonuclease V) beta subunit